MIQGLITINGFFEVFIFFGQISITLYCVDIQNLEKNVSATALRGVRAFTH